MHVFIFQAALLCEHCASEYVRNSPQAIDNGDSDNYPQGPYSNGGGEADAPQHCDHCRAFLDNPLTDHGRHYVAQALASNSGAADVLTIWRERYADQLEGFGNVSI